MDIGAELKKKIGPFPLGVWLAGVPVVGFLGYKAYEKYKADAAANAADATTTAATTTPDTTDTSGDSTGSGDGGVDAGGDAAGLPVGAAPSTVAPPDNSAEDALLASIQSEIAQIAGAFQPQPGGASTGASSGAPQAQGGAQTTTLAPGSAGAGAEQALGVIAGAEAGTTAGGVSALETEGLTPAIAKEVVSKPLVTLPPAGGTKAPSTITYYTYKSQVPDQSDIKFTPGKGYYN